MSVWGLTVDPGDPRGAERVQFHFTGEKMVRVALDPVRESKEAVRLVLDIRGIHPGPRDAKPSRALVSGPSVSQRSQNTRISTCT